MCKMRIIILSIPSLFIFCVCSNNTADLIVDPDSGLEGDDSSEGTDSDSDDGTDTGEGEDAVVANIRTSQNIEEALLKITMGFVEVPPFPPSGEAFASGSEYKDPVIGPDIDYLYESHQAGLTGQYSLLFVLYVDGGGIDEEIPQIGTDYVGYSAPVDLGPGTGEVWAGTVVLKEY